MNNQNLKLDGRTIAIGLLLLVAAVIFLPRLFNADSSAGANGGQLDDTSGTLGLGSPVSTTGVDRDGCPLQTVTRFSTRESVYVVAPNSRVTEGTSVFVRLYHDNVPVEDAPEITADRDYNNTCINFVFEPVDGGFAPGSYEAEFIINGNPGPSVHFEIQ